MVAMSVALIITISTIIMKRHKFLISEPQPPRVAFNMEVSLSAVFMEISTTGFDHREALRHGQFDARHDTRAKKEGTKTLRNHTLPVHNCHVSSLAHGPELCT